MLKPAKSDGFLVVGDFGVYQILVRRRLWPWQLKNVDRVGVAVPYDIRLRRCVKASVGRKNIGEIHVMPNRVIVFGISGARGTNHVRSQAAAVRKAEFMPGSSGGTGLLAAAGSSGDAAGRRMVKCVATWRCGRCGGGGGERFRCRRGGWSGLVINKALGILGMLFKQSRHFGAHFRGREVDPGQQGDSFCGRLRSGYARAGVQVSTWRKQARHWRFVRMI